MAFLPPVVGRLVKKGLQKGGLRAPQDPPGYALPYTALMIKDTTLKVHCKKYSAWHKLLYK